MTWIDAAIVCFIVIVLAIWRHGGENDKTHEDDY